MGFLISQTVSMLRPNDIELVAGAIAYSGDANSHVWNVKLVDGGNQYAGMNYDAVFILPDGTNVAQAAVKGSDGKPEKFNGSEFTIIFPDAVYAYAGVVRAFIRVTELLSGSNYYVHTIAAIRFTVTKATTGAIHIPTDVIMPQSELIAAYEDCTNALTTLTGQYGELIDISAAFDIDTVHKIVSVSPDYMSTFQTDYSTITAANTHVKYIDGKEIYQKTFNFDGYLQRNANYIGQLEDFSALVRIEGTVCVDNYEGGNYVQPLPYVTYDAGATVRAYVYSTQWKPSTTLTYPAGALVVRNQSSSTTTYHHLTITVWYTKTT